MTVDGVVRDGIVTALRVVWPGVDVLAGVAVDGSVVVHLPFLAGQVCTTVEGVVSRQVGRQMRVRGFSVSGGRMRIVLAGVSPG